MGRFKPLLAWPTADSATTLVDYVVSQLLEASVDDLVVVVGSCAPEVSDRIAPMGVRTVLNPNYASGKASSVRTGMAALGKDVTAIAVLGVDQPRPSWLLRRLFAAHLGSSAPVTVPVFQGRWGHPPVFDAALRDQLAAVQEETQGLRPVVRGQYPNVQEVDVGSRIALVNLNEPEDYDEAQRIFALAVDDRGSA